MSSDSISFDLGCNFDYKLFDFVEQYDKKHSIKSFFGKLKFDGLPGGRAASIVPDFTFEQLTDYVAECKKRNIEFNYLINPLSFDQGEIDPEISGKIREFMHNAYDIGIRAFTLNSPILIKYAKNEFKDIFITLGLYAYPTTIQHVEYWRSWGVDEITLDHSFNRKFDLLRNLMTQYKDSDFSIRVIANNLCLKECPFRLSHGSFTGHSDPSGTSMDYSLINCAYRKVKNPTALLSSEWIRPEDVHYYRELAEDTGFHRFSIKLIDRTRTSEFLERVVKAYMSEKYEGNLLDILNWPESKSIVSISGGNNGISINMDALPENMSVPPMVNAGPMGRPPQGMRPMGPPPGIPNFRFMERLKPESMMAYGRTMNFPKIVIDNSKLDGFLEHFINSNNCDKSLCANSILPVGESAPNSCKFCSNWADKAISFNEQEVNQWLGVAEGILKGIETGSIFR